MIAGIWGVKTILNEIQSYDYKSNAILVQNVVIGAILYFTFILLFEKEALIEILNLRKSLILRGII